MDINDIKALYKFLKNTDIVELELEDSRGKVKLKRGVPGTVAAVPAVVAAPIAAAPKAETLVSTPKAEEKSNALFVTSPMVGTFYRAPSPDANPFADVGSVIKKGQVVCIVEAMKIMNDVESEVSGKITAILVENGQPVEYGEPLFKVEPA
ncbi:MAG: acetyl-CoA carboxylase biotin carboxyl carrier protein [Deltaproteobacteria bacterium]|nr:acetyl-CoA carboxylase biotin carboxyl carrier protein [Deltaproteobacteria bacterium]